MSARSVRRLAAALVSTVLVAVGVSLPAAAAPTALPDPPAAALDWVEAELVDDGGAFDTSFDAGAGGIQSFPDWGLTIDAILALSAGGRGDASAATTAIGLVEANLASYVTGTDFGFPTERYAGPLAKAMLAALVQGEDPATFGGFDLEGELRARLQAAGPDTGRFSDLVDPANTFGGDFSNGFGQALAVLSLARTPGGVPGSAIAFLLDQQCPGGGFRGDYTTPGGCTDDASATVDATAFALQALVTATPSCAVDGAVFDGVEWLVEGQTASGAFGGESGSNTNSTGLAAVVLRSLGATDAADAAAGFVSGLQLDAGDDLGAVALNEAGLTAAGDGVQVLERDGFRRATTQGVLAFGLPSYGEIGTTPVDPDFTPCVVDPPAPPDPTGTLSASSVVAGGQLTVTGAGFEPGEVVDATLHSTPVPLGSVTADAQGAVTLTFTVPADLEPGAHRVELVGRSSGLVLSLAFDVLGVEGPGTLPVTGRTTGAQAGAGLGLVALGAALLWAGRHRRVALR